MNEDRKSIIIAIVSFIALVSVALNIYGLDIINDKTEMIKGCIYEYERLKKIVEDY